ncbi:MAG: SRPBCC domain-containing protein [Bacteroidota bacterium]
MSQVNWSKFTQQMPIKADMAQVYDAWTTRANLEQWFLRKAEFKRANGSVRERDSFIQKGDTYEWMWHGHPDTVVERGEILEANGKDKLQFVFGKAGIVTVNLKQDGDVTILEIIQENIPTDEESKMNFYVGCSTGWTFYRCNLKSILEGGVDLRNKSKKTVGIGND